MVLNEPLYKISQTASAASGTIRYLLMLKISNDEATPANSAVTVPRLAISIVTMAKTVQRMLKFSRITAPKPCRVTSPMRTPISWVMALLIVIMVIFIVRRLDDSKIGRAWAAIREDELAAAAMGIPTIDALGPRGKGFHTPDEYIDVEELRASVDTYERLARTLLAS